MRAATTQPGWFRLRRAVHGALDAAVVCPDAVVGATSLALAFAIYARAMGATAGQAAKLLEDALECAGEEP